MCAWPWMAAVMWSAVCFVVSILPKCQQSLNTGKFLPLQMGKWQVFFDYHVGTQSSFKCIPNTILFMNHAFLERGKKKLGGEEGVTALWATLPVMHNGKCRRGTWHLQRTFPLQSVAEQWGERVVMSLPQKVTTSSFFWSAITHMLYVPAGNYI